MKEMLLECVLANMVINKTREGGGFGFVRERHGKKMQTTVIEQ